MNIIENLPTILADGGHFLSVAATAENISFQSPRHRHRRVFLLLFAACTIRVVHYLSRRIIVQMDDQSPRQESAYPAMTFVGISVLPTD